MEKRFIYADNAATTAVSEKVLQAMLPYFRTAFGNASSIYKLGRDAQRDVEAARAKVAKAIGAEPREIFFTSCGSESDNWAIKGIAENLAKRGKKHIVTSVFEHHAVLHTCQYLEKKGFEVTYVPVSDKGLIDPEDVRNAIRDDTALVTIMYANNEIGTIQPIEEIAAICKEKKVIFHTDAVQALGHVDIDVKKQGIDMLSLSGHKIHAQKGIGALYVRKGTFSRTSFTAALRSATSVQVRKMFPAIVGLGVAIETQQRISLREMRSLFREETDSLTVSSSFRTHVLTATGTSVCRATSIFPLRALRANRFCSCSTSTGSAHLLVLPAHQARSILHTFSLLSV